MGISMTVLQQQRHKLSTKLYGVLHEIKTSVTQIQLKVVDRKLSGTIPVKAIEGYYIDAGYQVNGQRAFVKVHSGVSEGERWIIYVRSDSGQYGIQQAKVAHKNWIWIVSNEKAADQPISGDSTWKYYRTDNKQIEPIQLAIKAL